MVKVKNPGEIEKLITEAPGCLQPGTGALYGMDRRDNRKIQETVWLRSAAVSSAS